MQTYNGQRNAWRGIVRRVVFGVAWCVVAIGPALADVRILSSSGGVVSDYLKFFSQVRQSGERVVIDGPCLSACTLVLSTVPRNHICVTRRAVLGFHAPRRQTRAMTLGGLFRQIEWYADKGWKVVQEKERKGVKIR